MRKQVLASVIGILLVLSVFSVLQLWQIKPASAITVFSDGFETGDFTGWTGQDGTPKIEGTIIHHGSYAMNSTSTYDTYNETYQTGLAPSATNFRFYMQFATPPSDGKCVNFMWLGVSGGAKFLILRLRNATGSLQWEVYYKDDGADWYSEIVNTTATTGSWQALEICWIASASGTLRLYENTTEVVTRTGRITSTLVPDQLGIGTYTIYVISHSYYFDCVKVGTAYIGLDNAADTYPTYSSFGPSGSVFKINESVTIYSNWDDNDGLSTFAIQHNNTGTSANTTGSFSGGYWANTTITLNDTESVIVAKIFANDTSNQWNSTATFYIYVLSGANYTHEIRGMFIHESTLSGGSNNWTAIAENIAHYNFTDVYVQWGGSTEYNQLAPPIQATINIFHSFGLRIHYAPTVLGDMATNASWAMNTSDGSSFDWKCPSKPDVIAAIKTQMENATNTGFDGIMLDYIRYEIVDTCYCSLCRAAFQTWLGETVTNWTQYYPDQANWTTYAEWRIIPVTTLVSNIRNWTKAINSNFIISAAVWTLFSDSAIYWRKYLGQDVGDWIKKGYIDMAAPMMYEENPATFENELHTNTKYYSTKSHILPFIDVGRGITVANFTEEMVILRNHEMNGFVLWRYGGKGDTSTNANITDYLEAISMPTPFEIYSINATRLSSTSFSVEWHTNSSTVAILEYKNSDLFTYTWSSQGDFNYWWITHSEGTLNVNMTRSTFHKTTLTGLTENAIYYYRCISVDSGNYTSLEYTISLSGITVTIISPTNTTYTSPTISVSFTASGGTIDQYWFNAKNGTSWIYSSNQTGNSGSFTGFVSGASYTAYLWANNTEAAIGQATVMFTVSVLGGTTQLIVNVWWSNYW